MFEDEEDRPALPLEPPANVPELRAAYEEELFQYHQKLRAARSRATERAACACLSEPHRKKGEQATAQAGLM